MDTKDIVTLVIAVYGAALSSVVAAYTFVKERRQIKVELSPSFFMYGNGEASEQMASIDVINHGHRPVVVSAPTLQMPNHRHLVFHKAVGFSNFPKRLEDGGEDIFVCEVCSL
jgi:hypothetical protein